MAANTVGVLVDMSVRGRDAVRGAADDLGRIDGASKRVAGGLGSMAMSVAAVGAALGAAGFAAKKLYDTLRVGATLSTTQERFDKLTASIGTTADAMLGQLKTATKGMIDDMSLMASASQIISLKLADNSDQVVRLATVAGTLNWDMQQVILTFANMSTMRLDALGLSVEEVKTKAAELEKAGMSAQEAFKEAVILAGEARLDVGGVSETETAFKQLEAAITNSKSQLSLFTLQLADTVGLIDAMSAAAERMALLNAMTEAARAGEITWVEFGKLQAQLWNTEEAAIHTQLGMLKLQNSLYLTGDAVDANKSSWAQWTVATAQALGIALNTADYTLEEIARGIERADIALMNTVERWSAMQAGRPSAQAMTNRYAGWIAATNERNRAAEAERASLLESERAVYSYGGAVNMATSAEMALAEAHGRMAAAFNQEINAKIEDGLIDAAGLANMSEANKLLFQQAQAAGATAGQLAMLGVATGQFTAEQAQAALKAAILSEKIKQIAAGVVSGALTGDQAAAGLASFSDQLNSGAIADAQAGIEGATAAADDFASGSYEAELAVQNRAAMQAIDDTTAALAALTGGTYTITIGVNSPLMPGPTTSTAGGTGPEVVPTATTPGGRSVSDKGGGGTTYNVTISNFVDGRATSRTALDDVTTDSLKRAMSEIGIGKR